MKPRVFSGIQPSGSPHIGNYLGAIRFWARDQDRFENIFCVVDLHALTVPQEPIALRRHSWETAAILLACGIDPGRSLLFLQSHVREHAHLCWLLNSVTPLGWLNRMTQFKVKAGKERSNASAALYDYPVLMAADILAYCTDRVPVGDDQKQHVELARDLAERFNGLYGPTFTVPEPMIPEVGARIMSLDDPGKKMSKSDPAGALFLLDPPTLIRKKISRAVTDSLGVVRFNPAQPGLYNLLTMIETLSGQGRESIESEMSGGGYRVVKELLSDLVIAALEPIQERYRAFEDSPQVVDEILARGAERARETARRVVAEAEDRVGLRSTHSRKSDMGADYNDAAGPPSVP